MDDLTHFGEINGGYLMRHQLNELGYSDQQIRQGMKAKILLRVRHGTYVVRDAWATKTDTERHATIVHSVVDTLGDGVVVSHQSAAALHGLDLYDVDLEQVHVTRLDGGPGRREAGVVFHHGTIMADDVVAIDGRQVVGAKRAVFEACSIASIESGMVLASSALRTKRSARTSWSSRGASSTAGVAPGPRGSRSGSPTAGSPWSERRARSTRSGGTGCHTQSSSTSWRTQTAAWWPAPTTAGPGVATPGSSTVCSSTGLNPYAEPREAISREKVREDLVRGLSFGMSRWIWVGLAPAQQASTVGTIMRAMNLSKKLYLRNGAVIPLS